MARDSSPVTKASHIDQVSGRRQWSSLVPLVLIAQFERTFIVLFVVLTLPKLIGSFVGSRALVQLGP